MSASMISAAAYVVETDQPPPRSHSATRSAKPGPESVTHLGGTPSPACNSRIDRRQPDSASASVGQSRTASRDATSASSLGHEPSEPSKPGIA